MDLESVRELSCPDIVPTLVFHYDVITLKNTKSE